MKTFLVLALVAIGFKANASSLLECRGAEMSQSDAASAEARLTQEMSKRFVLVADSGLSTQKTYTLNVQNGLNDELHYAGSASVPVGPDLYAVYAFNLSLSKNRKVAVVSLTNSKGQSIGNYLFKTCVHPDNR